MTDANPLGDFLRARRAELSAEPAPTPGRRRVPGLRREEIATRARISVDYYARIEQGRAGEVSDAVLAAIAAALDLSGEQRAHLFTLAGLPVPAAAPTGAAPPPGLTALVGHITVPALVLGPRFDVLAANAPFAALVEPVGADLATLNLARFVLCDGAAHELLVDWPRAAQGTLARLRFATARHPGDPGLAELVADLTERSPWFAEQWPTAGMVGLWGGPGAIRHPSAGVYAYDLVTLAVPGQEEHTVLVFVPTEDSLATLHRLLP